MSAKKAIVVLLSILFVFSSFTLVADAQSPVLPTISLEIVQSAPGESFDMNVTLSGNPGIINLSFYVEYDSSVLTLQKVTDTGLFSGAVHSPNYSRNPYYLTWNNDTAFENITVNGVVAVLTFKVAENAKLDEYEIRLSYNNDDFDIFDFNLQPVYFDLENGIVRLVECLHKNVSEVSGKDATCTVAGLTSGFRCSDCGVWLTPQKEIPAKGHTAVKVASVEPTCTSTGMTEGDRCSVCGETLKQQTKIDALGHDMSKTNVIKKATATETGILRTFCSRCDYYIDSVIPLLTTNEDQYTLGDVDMDGNITASDARLALRQAVGLETYKDGSPEFLACDVDKDKTVTAADARMILRAAVGLEKL